MNLETPAGMSLGATRTESLKGFVAEVFARLGVPHEAARLTAAALVAADVEGLSPHGVALVPIYVERMLAGSVSPETEPTVMHDAGSTIVLPPDARDRLAAADGQLLAIDSVRLRGRAVWREPHLVRRSARRMSDGCE